jgi:hypothetical protein
MFPSESFARATCARTCWVVLPRLSLCMACPAVIGFGPSALAAAAWTGRLEARTDKEAMVVIDALGKSVRPYSGEPAEAVAGEDGS